MRRLSPALLALALAACDSKPAPGPAPTATSKAGPRASGPRFEKAPEGADFAAIARERRAAAEAEGRKLLIYVGAPWCEPCQHFHRAVEQGKLDETFAGLTFLELDVEVDRARLLGAGYASRYIPLFAAPGPDGRMTRFIEGSIKGEGAVAEITPRLVRLLEGKP